jgi:dephospho-CoA kinase
MLKVGLTGGVACGKTTITTMFEKRGAHIALADAIAHSLFDPGSEVYEKVVATFGAEILNPDKTISRPKLANAAFPSRIKELNAIVHPVVIARQDEWLEEIGRRDPHAIAIVEAALMIEAGAHKRFDKLIAVTCNVDQKVERFTERSHLSPAQARTEVERRMQAQIPEEEKARLADYVIDNSGTLEHAEAQVERIWQELRQVEAAQSVQTRCN